jgi:hypothetical protein
MTHIKSLMIAVACALVLPTFAGESDAAKAIDKARADAKADAKKPAVAKDKVAGQVVPPAMTRDLVDKASNGNGALPAPYSLRGSRWVPNDDRS